MLRETEIRAWADDEFVVGHILSSYIIEYTHLEECLAIGSLAQDEIAHARALYEYTGLRERDLDRSVFLREPGDFAVTPLATYHPTDFAELVVKQYLYELLDRLRRDAVQSEADETLSALLRTMQYEEYMHFEHWRHWIQILVNSSARPRLENALAKVGSYCSVPHRPTAWYTLWRAQAESELRSWSLFLGPPAVVAWQEPFAALITEMQSVFRKQPEVRLG